KPRAADIERVAERTKRVANPARRRHLLMQDNQHGLKRRRIPFRAKGRSQRDTRDRRETSRISSIRQIHDLLMLALSRRFIAHLYLSRSCRPPQGAEADGPMTYQSATNRAKCKKHPRRRL